ncbi:hypothetical protein [Burkholderia cenocepacia]|uniref:hypothetical protein n=1 Tax=Burkholderia cenocepacia TaxID=95486 RepID=UPI00192A777F|nr:hypothetical protein [Burkholderia cenocepacia]
MDNCLRQFFSRPNFAVRAAALLRKQVIHRRDRAKERTMKVVARKTDAKLLARLAAAAKKKLTAADIEQQRVSFVYSVMGQREGMTREKVENLLKQHAAV